MDNSTNVEVPRCPRCNGSLRHASGLVGVWVCQQRECTEFWQLTPSPDELALISLARQLIAESGHWTRSTPARRANFTETKPTAQDACMWCVVGAIARFAPAGIIPYNILRYLDEKVLEFLPNLPAVSREGFEWAHDRYFTHDMMLRFLDFVLTSAG